MLRVAGSRRPGGTRGVVLLQPGPRPAGARAATRLPAAGVKAPSIAGLGDVLSPKPGSPESLCKPASNAPASPDVICLWVTLKERVKRFQFPFDF